MPPDLRLVKGSDEPATAPLRFTHDDRAPKLLSRLLLAAALLLGLAGWLLPVGDVSVQILFFFLAAAAAVLAGLQLKTQLARRAVAYTLSRDRLEIERGLLGRRHESVELWSVRDVALEQSPLDRMFDAGTITIVSNDQILPSLVVGPIARAQSLYAAIRDAAQAARQRQRASGAEK
jgi:uncharacterized membrane protein YdbT with pleckstrin-like domain